MKTKFLNLKLSFLALLILLNSTLIGFNQPAKAQAIDPATALVSLQQAIIISQSSGLPVVQVIPGLAVGAGGAVAGTGGLFALGPSFTVAEANAILLANAAIPLAKLGAYAFLAMELAILAYEVGAIAYYTTYAVSNGATLADFDYGSAVGTCYNNDCGFFCGIWQCLVGS